MAENFASNEEKYMSKKYKSRIEIIKDLKILYPGIVFIKFNNDKRTMTCKDKFGEIKIGLQYHINGKRKYTIQSAINKTLYWANMMASINNHYDYSKSIYQGNKIPVIIICKEHGEFKVSPNDHMSKKCGCPKCGHKLISKSKTLSQTEFINKAKKKHLNKFDYSKTEYKGWDSKIIIKCPIHGEFTTIAYQHLSQKANCPKCSKELNTGKYSVKSAIKHIEEYKKIKAFIYILKCSSTMEMFFKIGITRNKIQYRINAIPYKCDIIYFKETNLFNAVFAEKNMLERIINYVPDIYFAGHTECTLNINKLKLNCNA